MLAEYFIESEQDGDPPEDTDEVIARMTPNTKVCTLLLTPIPPSSLFLLLFFSSFPTKILREKHL